VRQYYLIEKKAHVKIPTGDNTKIFVDAVTRFVNIDVFLSIGGGEKGTVTEVTQNLWGKSEQRGR